jgi:hypothetical protein
VVFAKGNWNQRIAVITSKHVPELIRAKKLKLSPCALTIINMRSQMESNLKHFQAINNRQSPLKCNAFGEREQSKKLH